MFAAEVKKIQDAKQEIELSQFRLEREELKKFIPFFETLGEYLKGNNHFQFWQFCRIGKFVIKDNSPKITVIYNFSIWYKRKRLIVYSHNICDTYTLHEVKYEYLDLLKELFQILKEEIEGRLEKQRREVDIKKGFLSLVQFE